MSANPDIKEALSASLAVNPLQHGGLTMLSSSLTHYETCNMVASTCFYHVSYTLRHVAYCILAVVIAKGKAERGHCGLTCWLMSAMEAPEPVAAREEVRTRVAADLAAWPSGLAPCQRVLLAACMDLKAAYNKLTGPVTTTTTTCKHKFLIDWISDTLSQGYTHWQSLVKCLDHRDIASDTVCMCKQFLVSCAVLASWLLD